MTGTQEGENMKATFIPKTDIRPGHRTVLGTVTKVEPSTSGKTLVITVRNDEDGHLFTDRLKAAGGMAVFTEEADGTLIHALMAGGLTFAEASIQLQWQDATPDNPPVWVRPCNRAGCVLSAPHKHGTGA
jgi:hypothetical protein